MAEPTKKSGEIEQLIKTTFGVDRRDAIRTDKCVECGGPAAEFKDELSRQEYLISGLCQVCQDKFWDG